MRRCYRARAHRFRMRDVEAVAELPVAASAIARSAALRPVAIEIIDRFPRGEDGSADTARSVHVGRAVAAAHVASRARSLKKAFLSALPGLGKR
jgi:hypothetical protein